MRSLRIFGNSQYILARDIIEISLANIYTEVFSPHCQVLFFQLRWPQTFLNTFNFIKISSKFLIEISVFLDKLQKIYSL